MDRSVAFPGADSGRGRNGAPSGPPPQPSSRVCVRPGRGSRPVHAVARRWKSFWKRLLHRPTHGVRQSTLPNAPVVIVAPVKKAFTSIVAVGFHESSLLHNYRGSGGRGQPSASAGVPEPGAAGFGASRRAEVWRNVADAGPAGAVRARAGAPSRSRGGVGGGRWCLSRWRQTMSRISRWTVRASTPNMRWQATLRFPRTRTWRPP